VAILCPKSIKSCALRITRLNSSGVPFDPLMPNSRVQTAGFIELNLSPDISSGDVTEIASKCGDVCITHSGCDTLKGFDLELKLCGVPLAVLEILIGVTLLDDGSGNFVGAAIREGKSNRCNNDPKMLELWTKNAEKGPCGPDGSPRCPWIHWVLPLTKKWEITGSVNFFNGPLEFTLSGYAENNPNWYPSLPGPAFPSYVPGGGDPSGLPTGTPPPVLPAGVSPDPWTLADQTVIQQSGPLAWKCVNELPSPIDDCGFLLTSSECVQDSPFVENFLGEQGNVIGPPWVDWPQVGTPGPSPVGPLILSGFGSIEPDDDSF
jgi:hypothetical protein